MIAARRMLCESPSGAAALKVKPVARPATSISGVQSHTVSASPPVSLTIGTVPYFSA